MKTPLLFLASVLFLFTLSSSYAQRSKSKNNQTKKVAPKKTLLERMTRFDIPIDGTPSLINSESGSYSGIYYIPYGIVPSVDFRVNADNTIDVCWENDVPHITRISLKTKSIVQSIAVPGSITGRFLGFESFDNGNKFIIGHIKENSFGQSSEAWYTAFTKEGTILFSTRIWGDKNLDEINSKGGPADAGSAMIRYNPSNNLIGIYLAHTMKWPDSVRHQAGWIGFLDAATGAIKEVGASWFYSHNFDQRLMASSDGEFYTLAHGDSYNRALAIHRWSPKKIGDEIQYSQKEFQYFRIPGTQGDNNTRTTTGDFTKLSNGNMAIAYSTEIGRKSRDLKVVIVSEIAGVSRLAAQSWITTYNPEQIVWWGTKIIQYSENELLVGWNEFNGYQPTNTHLALLDLSGRILLFPTKLDAAVLCPSQSFQKTKDGRIVFVSAAKNKLTVHVIEAP